MWSVVGAMGGRGSKKCDVTNKERGSDCDFRRDIGNYPKDSGAVILRSIQRDSDELELLQYGILAARGGVLGNVHEWQRSGCAYLCIVLF